jgi:hypothetical protein
MTPYLRQTHHCSYSRIKISVIHCAVGPVSVSGKGVVNLCRLTNKWNQDLIDRDRKRCSGDSNHIPASTSSPHPLTKKHIWNTSVTLLNNSLNVQTKKDVQLALLPNDSTVFFRFERQNCQNCFSIVSDKAKLLLLHPYSVLRQSNITQESTQSV